MWILEWVGQLDYLQVLSEGGQAEGDLNEVGGSVERGDGEEDVAKDLGGGEEQGQGLDLVVRV